MKRARLLVLASLAVTMAGCGGIVIDPLQSDPQNEVEDPGQTESPDPGNEATPNAIAMHMSQWNLAQTTSPLFQVSVVVDTTPDDLVLFFGSEAQACPAPLIDVASPGTDPSVCADQTFWQYVVVLPADRAQPGLVDLDDPSIYVHMATWAPDCGGGSANTIQVPGTLEITSMDAEAVSVSFQLTPQEGWPDGNGSYTAALCP